MKLIPILFWIIALVNLMPVVVAISPAQISKLYGIMPDDKIQIVLLQHRALLLGLVGAACAFAAHNEAVRWPAIIGAVISMGTFIIFCWVNDQMGGPLRKIALVDMAALPVAGILIYLLMKAV